MLIERADFADLDVLAAHRQWCWEQQLDYVIANSALHDRAWAGVVPPRKLDALAELPLIDKEMLRASQRSHPPFGDYLAAPAHRVVRDTSHLGHHGHGDEPRSVGAGCA